MRPATLEDYRARVLRVLLFIQQNLDRDLRLEELADLANFSPYHLHRIFHGMVGESLKAHIRRIRLERAAHRLRYHTDSVTNIAFDAGYETHEAFTRAFRTMTGVSPFRAQRRVALAESASGVHYDPTGRLGNFEPAETGGSSMDGQDRQRGSDAGGVHPTHRSLP